MYSTFFDFWSTYYYYYKNDSIVVRIVECIYIDLPSENTWKIRSWIWFIIWLQLIQLQLDAWINYHLCSRRNFSFSMCCASSNLPCKSNENSCMCVYFTFTVIISVRTFFLNVPKIYLLCFKLYDVYKKEITKLWHCRTCNDDW